MNKYQESLNHLKDYLDIKGDLNGDDNICHFNKLNIDTLQELIDNYVELKEDYDAVSTALTERLNKILDKSSTLIADVIGDCPHSLYNYNNNCENCDNKICECWKEYLLNDKRRMEEKENLWIQ